MFGSLVYVSEKNWGKRLTLQTPTSKTSETCRCISLLLCVALEKLHVTCDNSLFAVVNCCCTIQTNHVTFWSSGGRVGPAFCNFRLNPAPAPCAPPTLCRQATLFVLSGKMPHPPKTADITNPNGQTSETCRCISLLLDECRIGKEHSNIIVINSSWKLQQMKRIHLRPDPMCLESIKK
jgi:hypothetical protein